MGEWRSARFPTVIDFQEGPGILAKDFRDEGVPLVRLAGLERGRSVLNGCNYLDPGTVAERWAHFALKKGDILLSTSASLGRTAVVGDEGVGAIAYTGIIRMRPRDERMIPSFIKYFLEAPDFQQQAEIVGVGSVIRHFGPMHLRQMTVRFPSVGVQRAIASILGALDDKIDLNRRTSETLEATARALFKSWFIDFDSVADNLDRTSDWPDGSLADFVALNPESWSRANRPSSIAYVDLSNTKWGRIESITRHEARDAPSRAQRVLRPGDTIVGTVRPGNGSYAFIAEDGLTGSTGFAVLRPKKPEYAELVYLAATNTDNIERLAHLADGAAYPAVRPEVVIATEVPRAGDAAIARFSECAAPILARIAQSERESRTLANMRDTLLPKLISGELRIKDAERFVGVAV